MAFGSITTNKTGGGDRVPAELCKILKDDAVKMLHLICQQWPLDWEKSIFIPIPKKGNAKENSSYSTTALISHASRVMLKILQARLQRYVNWELPDVQAGFRKGRGNREQIANTEKARKFQKNIYFFFDYTKAFDCVDQNKLWKILRDGNTRPPSCLLRNLFACQEETEWTWKNGLVQNWERSISRLYQDNITLFI